MITIDELITYYEANRDDFGPILFRVDKSKKNLFMYIRKRLVSVFSTDDSTIWVPRFLDEYHINDTEPEEILEAIIDKTLISYEKEERYCSKIADMICEYYINRESNNEDET